jgi:hypothetical protein
LNTSTLIQKLWNCRNAQRDDRMSVGEYVEQTAATPAPAWGI